MKTFFTNHWLKLIAIVMLLGALTNYFPYFYYQLMNWVVVGAALTAVWQAYKQKNLWVVWLFALVAVVFNPFDPLHIQQEVWRIIDIVAAALLALGIIFFSSQKKK